MLTLDPAFLHSPPKTLLIGVSGGGDSVFLLHHLVREFSASSIEMVVCHLNHGLRGLEADQDAEFVASLTKDLKLPLEQKTVALAQELDENGGSLETLAREARLSFFREVSQRYQTTHLALAHHADDQAETILMNLCRGSAGTRGMPASRELKEYGLTVHRPLLHLRKKEMLAWLTEQKLSWREDASNQLPIAVRNRIRNEALPLLDDIFGREVTPALCRSHDVAGETLPALFPELLEHLKVYDPQGRLYLPRLQEFSPALQQAILHHYLTLQGIPDLTHALLQSCLKLISEVATSKINLPTGKFLRRKEKRIFLDASLFKS